jgi:hypothetical protein
MSPSAQVAVIGAGIAGLSCATLLQERGVTVGVFEKSQGLAGRMSTRIGDDWQCDHGAQCFTARQPDFRSEVERWKRAGLVEPWTPRLRVLGGLSTHGQRAGVERLVGTPSMTAPAHFLAQTLTARTGATIQELQRHPDGWRLLPAEGTRLEQYFDAVLLAVGAVTRDAIYTAVFALASLGIVLQKLATTHAVRLAAAAACAVVVVVSLVSIIQGSVATRDRAPG